MDLAENPLAGIEKSPTGIEGLDEITAGGLPKGRPTLVCGSAGCGKTLLGMEFLVHGATRFDEPGVLVTFEETPPELAKNVASLGVDLNTLVAQKKIAVKQRAYKSEHKYDLAKYGLTEEKIRKDCAFLYETFLPPLEGTPERAELALPG